MSKVNIAQTIFWYSISNRAGDLLIQVIDNGLEKYHIFSYIFHHRYMLYGTFSESRIY